MTRVLVSLLPALALIACDTEAPVDEKPPEGAIDQLEAMEGTLVEGASALDDWDAVERTGTVTIDGMDGDYSLDVDDPAGDWSTAFVMDLHLPGQTELSELSGQILTVEAVEMQGEEWPRSVVISDEEGPVMVADAGYDSARIEEIFGEGFVSHGTTVGTAEDQTWQWSYTSVVFQTDEGPVYLLPGEVTTITIDGQQWRAAASAAYRRDAQPDAALPGCPTVQNMLAYELMRLSESVSDELLERAADVDAASIGCGG